MAEGVPGVLGALPATPVPDNAMVVVAGVAFELMTMLAVFDTAVGLNTNLRVHVPPGPMDTDPVKGAPVVASAPIKHQK